MDWDFGLMEIGMISTICLLMWFIPNGVVSCKACKTQRTKKRATSPLVRNLRENTWKSVSVCCKQGGPWLQILASCGAHLIWQMSCTHVSLCITLSLRMKQTKIYLNWTSQAHLSLLCDGYSPSTTFKLAPITGKNRKHIILCGMIWFNICGLREDTIITRYYRVCYSCRCNNILSFNFLHYRTVQV